VKRYEAIEVIIKALNGHELIISANGMISRELFSIKDSANNFYMLGSMGLASSIGFGLAYNQPTRKVIIIDGDGNVLMNLGSLATIGHFAPKNLVHIVLDNGVHASTGGQPTVSNTARLDEIASAAGFRVVKRVNSSQDLHATIREALSSKGPSFVLAKIEKGEKEVPRVSYEPPYIKNRFKEAIKRAK
jgi:sulfopyruvate decarboxylase beta subunit